MPGPLSVDLLHDRTVVGKAGLACARASTTRLLLLRCAILLVQLGNDGAAQGLQLLPLVLQLLPLSQVVGVQPGDGLLYRPLHGGLVCGIELGAHLGIGGRALYLVGVVLQGVARLHPLAVGFVFGLKLLSICQHALDVLFAEAALVVHDGDLVLLARGLVHCRDVEDAVGVDVEGDSDLRNTTGSRGDARQLKAAQLVVVLGLAALALKHLDGHARLVVRVGGKDLLLLGGDGGVALDQLGHDSARSLYPKAQGCHVQQQHVRHLAARLAVKDGSLHSRPIRHRLVRVDGLA
mmetsp:Transcript_8403/g.24096  ORF Transcript_8403/g.24096 Transcript_8403/m.24096 type:complete len:293 (-) Transcript_8403:614-1492(-)